MKLTPRVGTLHELQTVVMVQLPQFGIQFEQISQIVPLLRGENPVSQTAQVVGTVQLEQLGMYDLQAAQSLVALLRM